MHAEAGKINCSILFNLNLMPQTTRSWQKLKKYIFQYLFDQDFKRKKQPQTPRSENWKKQNFNTILMRKYTKILAKAGKSKFQYFFI